MDIIDELQQSDVDQLLSQVRELPDEWHIRESLEKVHRYRVHVYSEDFDTILINSSVEERELDKSEYPPLRKVIDSIAGDMTFLNKTYRPGKLSGTTVKRLYEEYLQSRSKLQRFFIVDRDFYEHMNPTGLLYVRDGMHHLVAYGLAAQMSSKSFPISGYYSTNKERES